MDSGFEDVDVAKVVVDEGRNTFPNTTVAIAATHSVFNIANTILFIPFLAFFVRFLERVVPAKAYKEKPRLSDLDIRMLETPLLAIDQSRKEIERMGDGCAKMLIWLAELRDQESPDTDLADRLKQREKVLDSIQDEISVFVTNLLSGNVPHAVADEGRRQLRMADEYESVSDYIVNLDDFDRKLRRDGHRFLEHHRDGLRGLNEQISRVVVDINQALSQDDRNILTAISPTVKRVRGQVKQLRRDHLNELSDRVVAPLISVAYLASLNAYGRVLDHAINIAETISGEK